jgi:hypothetical protein
VGPIAGDSSHDWNQFVTNLLAQSKPIPDSRLSEDVAGT